MVKSCKCHLEKGFVGVVYVIGLVGVVGLVWGKKLRVSEKMSKIFKTGGQGGQKL